MDGTTQWEDTMVTELARLFGRIAVYAVLLLGPWVILILAAYGLWTWITP